MWRKRKRVWRYNQEFYTHFKYVDSIANMMILLKVARLKSSPSHKDSWVDVAGYAACGAECSDNEYGTC